MTEHQVGTVPADIGDEVDDLAPSGPAVLFVCTHNSGRSQMAVAFFNHLVGDRALGLSGGSQPAAQVDPLVVRVMAERGIDITGAIPKEWTDALLQTADVVIDMGCEDTDPLMFGHRFEMWPLPDPHGRGIEEIRAIRDDIEQRVRRLIVNLGLAVRSRV
ncbi:arsenate reductase ArsC [Nocardia huaxiensis]|uniref:Arsenate reductase ArsC n=1 Tax=Nocardia huaxiensis TaxID=2755382 RepID=A0A7D6VDV3_9NOCA|nr:arsenate reductase ArsC [Nocardia huaxiensis]QLY30517.1 arsenate reductase ArsC [Nocardia huaxiensis]UFS95884.1 arsenate reductase ArsC [Nocardia huaxiensis]